MTNALPEQGTDVDIVMLVQADHRAIRAQMAKLTEAAPGTRAEQWPGLVHALAVHEVAEEMVLFPAVRVVTKDYDAVLATRMEEQEQAEQLLVDMEDMDPSTQEFAQRLHRLCDQVLAHADAEERGVLPLIARFDDALDRPTLGARYEAAKRHAPTHPHPDAPHGPPGNMIAGPLISLFDRVRDHMG